jgi:hypothetical protein
MSGERLQMSAKIDLERQWAARMADATEPQTLESQLIVFDRYVSDVGPSRAHRRCRYC